MNDLSGVYSCSYSPLQQKKKALHTIVQGGSWICLILSPWMMILLGAHMMGFAQLTLANQILMTVIITCAIPQFLSSDKPIGH